MIREQLRVRGADDQKRGTAGDTQEVVGAVCRELGRVGVMSASIQSRTACYYVQWSLRS